ncbi:MULTISPECIES: APC family permease [Acidianus]|uniref:Amino acid transporter n=1 Tax=Candidatus Acidianus copahuensis TaxID=1160895 RepID=A0A031LQ97_9CREN|nr:MULTISPECIES: APC family permease [Acidianus]EZQ10547.1 amino acid transporter [Candidatus Acidianus copahuensis]NON62994.1 APC family permease [Acidianus sp. RZ1]
MTDDKKLKKEISLYSLSVIGLSSAVATAIFFSPLQMSEIAGPASLISWILGIFFYVTISLTYIELSQAYPEAGGPSRYSIYSHGAATNLINAMADLLWYLFIPPIEAFATIEGLYYIFPQLLNAKGFPTIYGAIVGVALMLGYIPFNYFGVRIFSRITSGFGTIKYIIYVLPALLLLFAFVNLKNFTQYNGFIPFGVSGIFAAMPYAMFAFGGARVIPDFAEEVKKKKDLIYALIITVIGEGLIYLLFDFTFISNLDWSKLGIQTGNWGNLDKIIGNPFIVLASTFHNNVALILLLIGGIVGPFLTGYVYMGGGARVMFASARSGFLHDKLKALHSKYAIPYWGLIVFAIIGAIIAFLFAPIPSIYGLIDDATVAGYIGFSTNPVAMIVLRRQGVTKYKIPGGSVISALAFISASLIVYWSGWPAVPYSVIILAFITAFLGIIGKVREGWKESAWYITYIAFLTAMTYIGSNGALNLISFNLSTLIVAIVSIAVFYPFGILQGLKQRNYESHTEAGIVGKNNIE